MGLTHPPEHRECNLQLQFWVPSWKCFMLPLHLPAGMHSSAPPAWALSEPCQQKLPTVISDLVQLSVSSSPFPALTSCLATSNSCAWQLIKWTEEWGYSQLPSWREASQQLRTTETPEIRMLSSWATNYWQEKREILQDLTILPSLRWIVVLLGAAVTRVKQG